jgi:peptidoglycan/LPS O-acetylase OafA/YrhL
MSSQRFHSLDALRALVMLLIVQVHVTTVTHWWWHSRPLEAVAFGSNELCPFRMPIFFLLSGFFGAFLLERRGLRGFVRHRVRSIALPLAAATVTIAPATTLLYALARGGPLGPSALLRAWHLWFLWYLALFTACALVVRAVVPRRQASMLGDRIVHAFLLSPWRLVPLVAAGAALGPVPFVGLAWGRPLPLTGFFFALGWLLNGRRRRLPELGRSPGRHALGAVGAGLMAAAVWAVVNPPVRESSLPGHLWPAAWGALTMLGLCCATFALFGASARLMAVERPKIRWMADATYWIFLVHLPLAILVVWGLSGAGAPLSVAYVMTLMIVLAIAFGTYGRLVRYTAVGRILHGPRSRSSSAPSTDLAEGPLRRGRLSMPGPTAKPVPRTVPD